MTATLGSLTQQFMDVYKLSKGNLDHMRHDSIHAISGFGIGIAEELRIAALETHLRRDGHDDQMRTLDFTFRRQQALYSAMTNWMNKQGSLNIDENGLNVTAFQRAQVKTLRLDNKEVEELHLLGETVFNTIRALTGKRYKELSPEQVAAIDFSQIDFTRAAHDIKIRYERPENAAIALWSAEILLGATLGTRREDAIPAPHSPWHDAGAQAFRSLKNMRCGK